MVRGKMEMESKRTNKTTTCFMDLTFAERTLLPKKKEKCVASASNKIWKGSGLI